MRIPALIILALSLGPAALPAASKNAAPLGQVDWPTFKGDNARSGCAASSLTPPVALKWSTRLRSSLYSSPVVADDRVYLGSSSKRLYCLDLVSGTVLWGKELPARVWGSTPTVNKGRVFIGAVDGCVYSLNAQSGEVVGTYCAQNPDFLGNVDVLSSPLVEDGRLVFGSDNKDIYGWDLRGQRPLWRYSTEGILHDNSASSAGGTVYMSSRDGRAYALDLSSGAKVWQSEKYPKAFNTAPALDATAAYFTGGDGILHALSRADGHELWRFETGRTSMSSPALDGQGHLVFGSGDKSVYALNAADGSLIWKTATADGVLGSPLITGGLVWIGSYDERLYALDLATGQIQWSAKLDGAVFTSPACSGNLILAAGRDGELACFEATYTPSAPSVSGK